ncbi:MAG: undecaprenyl-diphosphate phosphatase [Bacteroidales bacterium]|jgi:undecaprenyl-diphosphatase
MSLFQSIIIAIVEGLTEFLPVSSTGHMIITEHLLGVDIDDFTKAFTVNIQFGAILSVVVLYWKRFFKSLNFYYKLFVAVVPALVLGYLFGNVIDALLENVLVVAIMLLVGGVVLLFVDKWFHYTDETREPTYKNAFIIGLYQCIAMIPGVSRSAASIVGGMQQKLTRTKAAEFSFFLAVPTMAAASGYKLLSTYHVFNAQNIPILILGNVVAFIVAMLAIKFFITFLQKRGFKLFGYYRIFVGLVIIVLLAAGVDLKIV